MMHSFLANNRDELIARCKAKVAVRPQRQATAEQLANGVPMFLDQLTRTLAAEEAGESEKSLAISGASGGDGLALSQIGVSATSHGASLLGLGYTETSARQLPIWRSSVTHRLLWLSSAP
jgi:hypothetical protein